MNQIPPDEDTVVLLTTHILESDDLPEISYGETISLDAGPSEPFWIFTTIRTVETLLRLGAAHFDDEEDIIEK